MPVPLDLRADLDEAIRSGRRLRIHTSEGEVLTCQVLGFDERELRYRVLTSSRPERYAVCDATAFSLRWDAILRIALTGEPRARRAPRRGAGRSS
jgi:hypothetical protein